MKSKSRVKIKEEDMFKSLVRSLARRNYNSLGTYIRLIDYWVTETKVQINSADRILEETARENKMGAITAQVTYEANSMRFNSPETEF